MNLLTIDEILTSQSWRASLNFANVARIRINEVFLVDLICVCVCVCVYGRHVNDEPMFYCR